MTQGQWHIWLVEQSTRIVGPINSFRQGQRDALLETADAIAQRRLIITPAWVMQAIATERQIVIRAQDDPPERSHRPYHEGRLSAYQQMHMHLQAHDQTGAITADHDASTANLALMPPK